MPWKRLGEGNFNTTYIDEEKKEVLKVAKGTTYSVDALADTPRRSIRLWNILNPDLPKARFVLDPVLGAGWVCSYIHGRQSNAKEIHLALIDIYKREGG